MSALEDACLLLQAWVRSEGHERIQMSVTADGRVYFAATNGPGGDRVWTETSMASPDDSTPTEALQMMRGKRNGVRKCKAS